MKKWEEIATDEDALSAGLTEVEWKHIREVIGREITCLETGIFAALYSEHCSYKSTKVHLRTLPSQAEWVVQGPGENAGVVDIGDGEVAVFKVESHNHPSFIEPFQGAATGVGGILRDVFTMGARPIALMNALRFGDPSNARTSYLLSKAVAGIGNYGNCVGIPTVGGEVFFHESYDGNCLVNAFALGIAKAEKIFLGQASGVGNPVIYVGSKTGRDGIHGATMSSETFDEDSDQKRPTVQVGDPFQEKLLIEACLEVMDRGLVLGIQDMGAAGLTSSTYEMAERGEVGIRLYLDKVPQREEGMNPYELMLSESQERMLLVARPGSEAELFEVFHRWGLDAVAIGEVTKGPDVELFWHGKCVSALSPSVLTKSVPQYRWPEAPPGDYEQRVEFDVRSASLPDQVDSFWIQFLSHHNNCSRAEVFRQYDSTVRTNTVIHPGGDAAVVRIKQDGERSSSRQKGLAMTLDCNSRYCAIDPRLGTALTVAEAVRNVAAVGGTPLGISDCLNFGSPTRPESMWQIAESIRGLGDAARAFGVPVISGNVSLNNESKGKAILPTPQIALVGLVKEVRWARTIHFKKKGDLVFLIGATNPDELGGSEFLAISSGIEKGALPRLDYDLEMKSAECVRQLLSKELLQSCHDLSSGGLATALPESCFGPLERLGVEFEWSNFKSNEDCTRALFSESGARYLISCEEKAAPMVQKFIEACGLSVSGKGRVGGDSIIVKGAASIPVMEAYQAWRSGLSGLLGL